MATSRNSIDSIRIVAIELLSRVFLETGIHHVSAAARRKKKKRSLFKKPRVPTGVGTAAEWLKP